MKGSRMATILDPTKVTRAIADPYAGRTLSQRARARRWQEFERRFPDIAEMRVIDLGGDARYWAAAPVRPAQLVLLNLYEQEPPFDGAEVVVGDACELSEELRNERFDLVYSNSAIEHVGGHSRRAAFADSVRALADRHWIQTPYRYFPIEPHWLFPGFQFLPVGAQATVTQTWRYGQRYTRERASAVAEALSVRLLSKTELRHYFPASDVWTERIGGVVKSLVAVSPSA
jgi:Methyltransferase domain